MSETQTIGQHKLDEESEKVIKEIIDSVLGEFNSKGNKYFTADVLHGLRLEMSKRAVEKLGREKVMNIDIGLDLSQVENYNFFFRVNIPKEEAEKTME